MLIQFCNDASELHLSNFASKLQLRYILLKKHILNKNIKLN